MNTISGIINFKAKRNLTDDNDRFLKQTVQHFPSQFEGVNILPGPHLSLAGNLTSSQQEGQQSQLYFEGEIFNSKEIAAALHSTPEDFHHVAELIHRLILEKGIDAVKNINGQFIIIFFDKQQQKIYIINDHLGIQQLFYYHNNNIFLFASEIKFLLSHPECPKEIDWETALRRPLPFTVLSSFSSYKTWFKEISLMPESTIFEIDLNTGKNNARKYWNGLNNIDHPVEEDNRTTGQVMEEYMSLLEDAVKIRIPEGGKGYSLLSGGLDSSVVCALAAKHRPMETFSIITQTTFLEGTTLICDKLSKDFGFSNTQFLVPFHELSFNAQLWKQRIWRAESPYNHTDSLTKTLLHYAIRKKDPALKYVLTGTGSDQFNGGLVRWIVNDSETKEENWDNLFNEIIDTENRKMINRSEDGFWNMRKFINRDFLATVSGAGIEKNSWMCYVNSALHTETYGLLWDETRASAYHGHSTRFPYLDFRFADFISKIPPRLHKELFYDKQILRVPSKKILPGYVSDKPKAPSVYSGYDFRFRLFDYLTSENDGGLFREAFGDINDPHPVINKKALLSGIEKLKKQPKIYDWQYIMHIINLGILEKLPGKNEADMNYESMIDGPLEISHHKPVETKIFLEKRLSIKTTEQIINEPLQFAESCSLLHDTLSGKLYLSKKNALAYEVEDEYKDWKQFLLKINNRQTTQQILNELGISFETIEEFFRLCLKEEILTTKENHQIEN